MGGSVERGDRDRLAQARRVMLDRHLRARGVTDPVVLGAMEAIPREDFLPPAQRSEAYDDRAQPIGHGQTISQPYMVGIMTQLLVGGRLRPGERLGRVLEVGGGSGYQAAVLSKVAERVWTVERLEPLVTKARETLGRLGIDNVEVVLGDGTLGLQEAAPYDGILVAAGAPRVPEALRAQLAPGGRLVIPVGPPGIQVLTVVERVGDDYREEKNISCVFVPLIGQDGWPEGGAR